MNFPWLVDTNDKTGIVVKDRESFDLLVGVTRIIHNYSLDVKENKEETKKKAHK